MISFEFKSWRNTCIWGLCLTQCFRIFPMHSCHPWHCSTWMLRLGLAGGKVCSTFGFFHQYSIKHYRCILSIFVTLLLLWWVKPEWWTGVQTFQHSRHQSCHFRLRCWQCRAGGEVCHLYWKEKLWLVNSKRRSPGFCRQDVSFSPPHGPWCPQTWSTPPTMGGGCLGKLEIYWLFLVISFKGMIDNYVRLPTFPNCLEGRRLFVHFSISLMAISNLQKGSITVSLTLTSFSRSRYEIKVPGRDDAALVQPSGQVDHDLARAMIVDDLMDGRVVINY